MFNESFTAYLNRDLQPIFRSLGIEFDGRNYAMGGTEPGFELSACFDQIFGTDVDFFSMDFGMPITEGKLIHFLYRGLSSPGRPAMMFSHVKSMWMNFFQTLESKGAITFVSPESIEKQQRDAIPDSSART